MKLKTASFTYSASLLILFGLFSVALLRTSRLLKTETRDLIGASNSVQMAKELKSQLLIHNRNAFLYHLKHEPRLLQERVLQRAKINEQLKILYSLEKSETDSISLAHVSEAIQKYFSLRDEIEERQLPPLEKYQLVSDQVDGAAILIDQLIAHKFEVMKNLESILGHQNQFARGMAWALLAVCGLILVGLLWVSVLYIANPLVSIAEVIRLYSIGNEQIRAPLSGLVEIRKIAETFNKMADRISEKRIEHIRFIGAIAHDLRNPLSSISMAAEALQGDDQKSRVDLSKIIYNQSLFLNRLVGDLLEGSRIEAGNWNLKKQKTILNELIVECVRLFQSSTNIHKFIVNLPTDPMIVFCDRDRMSQVLNNLISNAIKYSPFGGEVVVRGQIFPDRLFITITDHGIGIAPEDQVKIFSPFYRAKQLDTQIPGIGLGLSSSRKIVEAHGGILTVESELGEGSVFKIELPNPLFLGTDQTTFNEVVPNSTAESESSRPSASFLD